ncbi:MAG: 3-deoxy-8-phosphooctulonate synthase [bacterium]
MTKELPIGDSVILGGKGSLGLIAGPCVIESEIHCLNTAEKLAGIAQELRVPFIFKTSYDKANRSSIHSYRGPGLKKGLEILKKVKKEAGVLVLTDVHLPTEVEPVAEVVDVIQIPAFLCRQTDLLIAAAETGKVVNVKKGQFMAPQDMAGPVEKIKSRGNERILLTERGTSFGYHNLVVDMRSLPIMRSFGFPVIFDATHAVQLPGGGESCSGGEREFVPCLARAAVAAGCDGVFLEVHPSPNQALCDGPNMISLEELKTLWPVLVSIHQLTTQVDRR